MCFVLMELGNNVTLFTIYSTTVTIYYQLLLLLLLFTSIFKLNTSIFYYVIHFSCQNENQKCGLNLLNQIVLYILLFLTFYKFYTKRKPICTIGSSRRFKRCRTLCFELVPTHSTNMVVIQSILFKKCMVSLLLNIYFIY